MARPAQTASSPATTAADAGLHSLSWLVWAVCAATAVQIAPNPFYATIVIGIAALVVETFGSGRAFARAFPVLVTLGVVFALLRTVLTALTTHTGAGTVLFTMPVVTLPKLLGGFTLGGSIELEVLLQSIAEGLVIVAVMAVFGAFNAVASHYELVQAAPRAFYELGLVVTVALAFVPSTLASIAVVREADRCRTGGRPVRRRRLIRQMVPVVELGLERAISLAESMDARGFGYGGAPAAHQAGGWAGLGALVALAARSSPSWDARPRLPRCSGWLASSSS
jgi:energy-coupling factor transport system permease protein